MSFVIDRALYPRPTVNGSGTAVSGQARTVTSTAAVQFASFNSATQEVMFDIQGSNVYCTVSGETPASGTGHILYVGQAYTWSKALAAAAKFVATTTTNATIWASELMN